MSNQKQRPRRGGAPRLISTTFFPTAHKQMPSKTFVDVPRLSMFKKTHAAHELGRCRSRINDHRVAFGRCYEVQNKLGTLCVSRLSGVAPRARPALPASRQSNNNPRYTRKSTQVSPPTPRMNAPRHRAGAPASDAQRRVGRGCGALEREPFPVGAFVR